MAFTVILHVASEEPIVGEVEQLPTATDVTITIQNPRRRDGKDMPNLAANVTTVIFPMNRMTFIEVVPSEEEEKIFGVVRE
ncbi:MAG: hypothetical protein HY023_06155 [Chloroflexi bacterium]|nr:hypothetical protein [Chloroflexota bacterium]MBI3763404.1 hypothetical protein [Chloroflexota bacterium]